MAFAGTVYYTELAFFIGYNILFWEFKKEKKDTEGADQLLMYMFFAILIGARLGHLIFLRLGILQSAFDRNSQVWKGGLASHGAAMAIPIALYLYKRKHPEQSFLWIIDRVAIPTALGGSFIRYGNFFNSEIVGDYTDGSWGIIFDRLGETQPRVPISCSKHFYTISFLL